MVGVACSLNQYICYLLRPTVRYLNRLTKISIPLALALFIGAGASHAQSENSSSVHSLDSQPPASVASGIGSLFSSNNARAGDAGADLGSCNNEKHIPCGKNEKGKQRCCRKVCELDPKGDPLRCGSDTISCEKGYQVCAKAGYAACCPEGRCSEDPRSGCKTQDEGDDNDLPGNGGVGPGNGGSGDIGGIGGGVGNGGGGVRPPNGPGNPVAPGNPDNGNPGNGNQDGNDAPNDPADPNDGPDDQDPGNDDQQDEGAARECSDETVDQLPPCEQCKCYAELDRQDCIADGGSSRECREEKRAAVARCLILPESAPGCAGEGPWEDCCQEENRNSCKINVCKLFREEYGLNCPVPEGCHGTENCNWVVRLCCGQGVSVESLCGTRVNLEEELAGCYDQTQQTNPPAMPACVGQPDNEEEPGDGGGNNGGGDSGMPDSPPQTGGGMPTPITSGTAPASSSGQEPVVESGVVSSPG